LSSFWSFGCSKSARFQEGNDTLIRRQNDFFSTILHGFRVNEVAVVVVNDENVRVAADGWDKETSGGVRVDLAGGRLTIGAQKMGFESRRFRIRDRMRSCKFMLLGCWFGGLNIGAFLVEVPFDHGNRLWWVSSNLG